MSPVETGRMGSKVQMRAPVHYLRVDLEDAAEAEYWMVVFDTTRERLEKVVASVGRDAIDVRAALHLAKPAELESLQQLLHCLEPQAG